MDHLPEDWLAMSRTTTPRDSGISDLERSRTLPTATGVVDAECGLRVLSVTTSCVFAIAVTFATANPVAIGL
jgi:hypothetical protein